MEYNYLKKEEIDLDNSNSNESLNSDNEDTQHSDISKWEWGSRKSAFLPYKHVSTVLTNLQRGNTEATDVEEEVKFDFHTRAAQGEITLEQLRNEGCDVKDENGFTALHWAAFYGQNCTVVLLLDNGANVDMEGYEHETALLLAASGGHRETIKILLDNGADVNHFDIIGNTALMYAAAGNHPHSCNNLLQGGAQLMDTNDHGETAYSLAVHKKAYLAQAIIENHLISVLNN